VGSTSGILIFLLFLLIVFFFYVLLIRKMTGGKVLCYFLEKDKGVKPKLLPMWEGDFTMDKGNKYQVRPQNIRFVRYPGGMPPFMQVIVPALLYESGKASPLDWVNLDVSSKSSKELDASLEPHWLRMIVKRIQEQAAGGDKLVRIATLVGAMAAVLGLILIFVVMTKLGSINSNLGAIKNLLTGGGTP